MTEISMAQALNAALRDAVKDDDRVLIFGEDVGPLGGVFRVTDGITADFGEDRCFDTPLAESGIVGFAVGMAMGGFRPVVEMQFDAFAYPAFEQITSHVAKLRNRTRGALSLPMVIRIPYAGGIGGVEHHCDSSEAYYTHTPGLRVVTPGTPQDAYDLLRDSIDSPDPVIFLEPKCRYWSKEPVSFTRGNAPMDRAVVRREGKDVTLIAYGPMVATALETAEAATAEGWDVEVVDLRSLNPFDDETVPVVRDAGSLSTRELSAAIGDKTTQAREGKLGPAGLTGGTFTVNNYGVFGVDGSAAIINHPEAAILGIGRIIDRAWVVDGALVARKVCELTLAFDHRVCDGGTAGGFLRFVADCVESPVAALGDL